MNITSKLFALLCISIITSGCGGSSSSINEQQTTSTAKFSLGLSDAPVDDAVSVYIELDSINLTPKGEVNDNPEITIEKFTDESGAEIESIQVNLLDFQGNEQLKVIDEAQNITLENGVYDMELIVIDSGSYVLLENDVTEHGIKVPSSRLRLGEFTVNEQAIQVNDKPAYTVEFDLRQSLVLRGNSNNNNGFIIKPHGVRVVSLTGDVNGTVSPDLTNLGDCTVYLYDSAATEYGDVHDTEDENFVVPDDAITASAPLATALVQADGSYSIGFIPTGNYQLALYCGVDVDDNVQFDDFSIPSASDLTPDVMSFEVTEGQTTTINF